MGEPFSSTPPPERASEERLDSWKEIAAYLNRDVTTVQRWEKREAMPVHRHLHDKRGSVYALTPELDAWIQSRRQHLEEEEEEKEPEAVAAPGVLAVLAIAYILSRGRADRAAQPKIRSLAVLPLKNLSGDPGQEYLADGMTEALIGRLAQIHDLRVISHTSVMRFKNPQMSVTEIARTLKVDAIVEGSVMRDGSRIRVTAQLIRGATDEHFWSETYDRELRDALSLESDLAQTIAEKVEVTVTGEEERRLTATRPVAPQVYESYSKGEFALNTSSSKAEFEATIPYFEDALKRDPTFAPAYVGLANAYGNLGTVFVGGSADEMRPKVTSAAEKALELDPNLAEAHVLLANVK